MSSNLFAIVNLATVKLKIKMLLAGFPVALWSTAIQCCDRHGNRSFLFLRIADFVVDADVLDVSVSDVVAFPPGEHLVSSRILNRFSVYIIVSSLMFLPHKLFLSFLIRQKRELTLRMSFCPGFCTNLTKIRRC